MAIKTTPVEVIGRTWSQVQNTICDLVEQVSKLKQQVGLQVRIGWTGLFKLGVLTSPRPGQGDVLMCFVYVHRLQKL